MKYLVLRDCYKKDVYYSQGEVRDLPESLVGSSIHFQLVEAPDAPGLIPEPLKEETNPLACPECGRVCATAFGLQSHSKVHKGDKMPIA